MAHEPLSETDGGLITAARSGARWQGAAQVVELVLGTVILIVLAGLVGPRQFGTFSIAVAVSNLIPALFTTPIGSAVVAQRLDSDEDIATAWLMAFLPAVVLGAALALAGLVLAGGSGTLAFVSAGLALPVSAGALVVASVLQHRLQFRAYSQARVCAAVSAAAVALLLVAVGEDFLALVSRLLVAPIAMTPVLMLAARWRPHLGFSREVARRIFVYARGVTGFNALNQFARRGDDLLVAAILGSRAVGFYSLSYRFIEAPLLQVSQLTTAVSFPTLVRIADETRFRLALLRAQKPLVWLVAPMGICSIALGDKAVVALLGQDWSPAGGVIQVFGGIALLQAAGTQVGPIYLARDATGLFFKWSLFAVPVILGSIVIGTTWGIQGVAWAYLGANLVLFAPSWNVPGRLISLTVFDVLRSLRLLLGAALAIAASAWAITHAIGVESLPAVLASGLVAALGYWAVTLFFDRDLARELLALIPRRGGQPGGSPGDQDSSTSTGVARSPVESQRAT